MASPSIAEDQAAMSASEITVLVDVVPFGFRDPVKFNDYQSYGRLAYILGLDNKAAVKAWMASESFKPAYDELVCDWIDLQWDKAVDGMRRKRAPTLKQITQRISKAPERYTSATGVVDKTNFVEIDHYALCLVLLRAANETNPNGVFRGKTCSDENKDQRLWQAMLRGGTEAWYHRKRRVKLTPGEEMYA
ncbi:hypothetical protein VE01_01877 [Pseudogymnoascus verrucosus]|uniref:Uncharacterized protein n=1 Tax=Pseudogymnoascus verrucosus TaxID=342668 RepID=A0A1B8GW47_9PEZI|nr:uncharacterized protein VE01_01877 [Pseudogymnoascus verrucosus]OBU00072.1 hypothetical protein VE01_01877 [Pseudogymnoascus verrucosus]